ncbi:MAG: SDR family NAD(P)-dependent oxidoreductase [Bacteroidales bacterium]
MRDLRGKRTLITGGAAGIGRTIAERLVPEGAELVLVDLNEQSLNQTLAAVQAMGAEVSGYCLDVTDIDAIPRLRDRVHQDLGPIDILVNNAGIVYGGALLDVPLEKHLRTYRVNVEGLVAMTYAFFPDLLARPEAHLVNIASAAGLVGLPFGSTYASSKWAVIGFSESLRLELELMKRHSVKVTTVCPSYVSTGLFDGVRPPTATSMLTPEDLAEQVVDAIKRDHAYVLTPWLVRVTPVLKGVLPTRLFDAIAWSLGATSSMVHWRGHSAPQPPAAEARANDAAAPERAADKHESV